jgi:PAB-dependent poly(A)-specific ribonuclease subunit 2
MKLATNDTYTGNTVGCFNPAYNSYNTNGLGNTVTNVTIGGPLNRDLQVLDIYTGLQPVTSINLDGDVGCTALTSSTMNSSSPFMLVGCSDGSIRLVDGNVRSNSRHRYDQQIAAHTGPIKDIAVSDCGNYVASCGYVNKGNAAHANAYGTASRAYDDLCIMTFDVRMLSRGSTPIQFSGSSGSPSYLKFGAGDDVNRTSSTTTPLLYCCSNKPNGGIQIIEPFGDPTYNKYLQPSLEQNEFVTCMDVSSSENVVSVGTSHGSVISFEKCGSGRTIQRVAGAGSAGAGSDDKYDGSKITLLHTPPFTPTQPAVSIDPAILLGNTQTGSNLTNPFNYYGTTCIPNVSVLPDQGSDNPTKDEHTFYDFVNSRLYDQIHKRLLSASLDAKLLKHGKKNEFVTHIRADSVFDRPKITNHSNHNQMIYNHNLADVCYDSKADPRKRALVKKPDANPDIPVCYRLTTRPTGGNAAQFDFSYTKYNNTSLWPGWDAGNNTPNSYASPVLVLMYFIPEIRASLLREQFEHRIFSEDCNIKKNSTNNFTQPKIGALSAELGFLFHQMDSLSNFSLTTPNKDVGAWQPSNFFATFSLLPEAAALALLDSSSTAVKLPKRIEAFYRFLVLHLNQEMVPEVDDMHVIDSLQSFNIETVNTFVTGDANAEPTKRSNKALTVELTYDKFVGRKVAEEFKDKGYFSDVLSDTLCRETRIRAWCNETRAYETVVQKKSISSLPGIFAVQCSCAGGDDGSVLWKGTNELGGTWLPEVIEIECLDDGGVSVAELVEAPPGAEGSTQQWYRSDKGAKQVETPGGCASLKKPRSVSVDSSHSAASAASSVYSEQVNKRKFELIGVVSYIRNDEETDGHHVVHVKVPKSYVARVLTRQGDEGEHAADEVENERFKNRKESKPDAYEGREKRADGGADGGDVEGAVANLANLDLEFSGDGGGGDGQEDAAKEKAEKETKDALNSERPPANLSMASRLSARVLRERIDEIRTEAAEFITTGIKEEEEWVLFNGFVVTKTDVADARAFNHDWKDPCLCLYRSVDDAPLLPSPVSSPANTTSKKQAGKYNQDKNGASATRAKKSKKKMSKENILMSPEMLRAAGVSESDLSIPLSVMNARPINDVASALTFSNYNELPGKGEICAIDTEFVSVQSEDSVLTANGGKIVTMDARSALARISVIDCRNGQVIIDDYVLPQEPVVDYLTRFSGITPVDLDPLVSPRHLVSTRTAYLKLRLLVDRGVILVGHGLKTDFSIVNIFVPPAQIIDTVVIFSQPRARMIGLRFLVNFLFGHDMQTDTHDSIEDARAAWEVYKRAVELKSTGEFDRTLTKIYEFGRKTEWKLGVAVQEREQKVVESRR